jgi:hypothetical protein
MYESRRRLLTTLIAAAGVLVVRPILGATTQRGTPQPIPSPNAPNPSYPPGLNGPDITPSSNNKVINPQNQRDLRDDVQQLYELASELKQQFEKTDTSATLSLTVVKQAQKIEKLAKRIKDLAKG